MDYLITRDDGSQAIAHFGIKGQKHGIRRYQNEDGSLTAEGRERYGSKQDYSGQNYRTSRQIGTAPTRGVGWLQKKNAERLQRDVENAKANGDEKYAEKKQRRLDAQKAAQSNLEAYSRHTSTGKHVAQNLLLGIGQTANYQHARARGSGRLRSLLESTAGATPIATLLRISGDRKKYGAVTLSDNTPGEIF
jgi:hypothetical protein